MDLSDNIVVNNVFFCFIEWNDLYDLLIIIVNGIDSILIVKIIRMIIKNGLSLLLVNILLRVFFIKYFVIILSFFIFSNF